MAKRTQIPGTRRAHQGDRQICPKLLACSPRLGPAGNVIFKAYQRLAVLRIESKDRGRDFLAHQVHRFLARAGPVLPNNPKLVLRLPIFTFNVPLDLLYNPLVVLRALICHPLLFWDGLARWTRLLWWNSSGRRYFLCWSSLGRRCFASGRSSGRLCFPVPSPDAIPCIALPFATHCWAVWELCPSLPIRAFTFILILSTKRTCFMNWRNSSSEKFSFSSSPHSFEKTSCRPSSSLRLVKSIQHSISFADERFLSPRRLNRSQSHSKITGRTASALWNALSRPDPRYGTQQRRLRVRKRAI